jgi:predicted Zn-dependent protease
MAKRVTSKKTTKKKASGATNSRRKKSEQPLVSAAAKARKKRSDRAMRLYEDGVTGMQKHKFEAAQKALQKLVDEYPEERELDERARLYLAVCDRELTPEVADVQTAEDRLYAATIALNSGSVDEALQHLKTVVRDEPENPRVQYMFAIAYALANEADLAVAYLERSIELEPDNRILARQEPDFDHLHEDARFEVLTASEEETEESE